MPRKLIELPPEVARRFVDDMGAYFAETNLIKRDESGREDGGSKPKGFSEGVCLGRARELHPIFSEAPPCLSISPVCCFLCV